jgi:anti-anti-sigma regulatory factor
MDALRVMQLQDEFELVALDFCVTYEVSPPAWQDARCHFYRDTLETSDGLLADNAERDEADRASTEQEDFQATTVPMGFETVPATLVELSGEILGEAADALARLENARQGGERLVISCANLIRVDFSAAGSILNWVALRQAEGCHLQFREVHRLVAAFFIVIGIHEHARVVLRSN